MLVIQPVPVVTRAICLHREPSSDCLVQFRLDGRDMLVLLSSLSVGVSLLLLLVFEVVLVAFGCVPE